jgi:hypothetical protein
MIRHVWSLAVRSAITDKETNLLSLIEVADTFEVPADVDMNSTPIGVEQLEIVSLWCRKDLSVAVTGEAQINYYHANGELAQTAIFPLDLTSFHRVRTKFHTRNLTITSLGRIEFEVLVRQRDDDEWEMVAKIPIDVISTAPQPSQGVK